MECVLALYSIPLRKILTNFAVSHHSLFSLCDRIISTRFGSTLAVCARKSVSASVTQDVTAMSRCRASVLFWITPMSFSHPLSTREHKASIENAVMSLTMCGCFQLTSEACYKYSDAAHCAPLLSGTQTDAIADPDST